MKRKWTVFLAMLLTVGLIGGCNSFSSFKNGSNNYGPYVQSLLDVSYKNDSKVYLELVDDTEEAAQDYYDNTMLYWAYNLGDYFNMVLDIDQSVEDRMVGIVEDIFTNVKYEVADAEKSGDYYTVQVTVYPILYTDLVYDEVADYAEDFDARTDAGEFGDISNDQDAYNQWEITYANGVMDILETYSSRIETGDPVEKIVKIQVDEDDTYGITEDDQMDVESLLLK